MNDNEFILSDRIQKIQQIIKEYGESNFYCSFSGGKDSTVLSTLIDIAVPNNNIPRVYADTGIELNLIREFVKKCQSNDSRIIMLKPNIPVKPMLEKYGYPFKSKEHAKWVDMYQRNGRTQSIENYLGSEFKNKDLYRTCPKKLRYQFQPSFSLKISDKCCLKMKEEPIDNYAKANGKLYGITGIMRDEGGRRTNAQCLAFKNGKLRYFHPLSIVTKDWEEWFIEKYHVVICDIYKEPYNFPRTGCKGCPFAIHLQEELDILDKYFPAERKQCEIIWGPIYDEYRRIGYRLHPNEIINGQISIEDYMSKDC